jgi:GNAT superfamily N-acetyltransferase
MSDLLIRDHLFEDLEQVRLISEKTWSHFVYNNENRDKKITCVVTPNKEVVGVGYLKHGLGDGLDTLEINMNINNNCYDNLDTIREALYQNLFQKALEIRRNYPTKLFKLVAWDDLEGDRQFYCSQGFNLFQTYSFASRHLENIPSMPYPDGMTVKIFEMKEEDEKKEYVEMENLFYQGVVHRSIDMLKWMMGGPVLHTITAFDGDKIAGSVMNWTDGNIDRCFVVPKWRKKGLAKYLISKSLEFHKELGLTKVQTLVLDSNEEGKGLLQSLGYNSFKQIYLLGIDI